MKKAAGAIGAAVILGLAVCVMAALGDAATPPPGGANNGGDFFDRQSAAGTHGAEVFRAHCAACHESGAGHAPPLTILGMMPASSIFDALSQGAMRVQGQGLSRDDKIAVAEYLSGRKMAQGTEAPAPMCAGAALDWAEPPVLAGWGLTPGNTRSTDHGLGGLDARNVDRLHLAWAFAFPDALRARSHPALAGGAIFVGSHNGEVYALDRASGCVRWRYRAGGEVRTGLVVSPWKAGDRSADPLVYFGDLVGNVYALHAKDGSLAWRAHPDDHPSTTITAAPALDQGRLYVAVSSLEEAIVDPRYQCCTFRGSVVAYDGRTGRRLWQTFMTAAPIKVGANERGAEQFGPSGAPIWNTPAIDEKRHQLYVGTGDNYSSPTTDTSDAILALDLSTGKINWTFQTRPNDAWNVSCQTPDHTLCPRPNGPDYDIGAAVVLATAVDGRDYVLAGSKSGDVYAVDPDTGKLRWDTKVGRGGVLGGVYFGMAVAGDRVFVPVSDTDDHQPHAEPGRPGLYALDLRTGRYLWKSPYGAETCQGRALCGPGIAAAVTVTGNLVLTGGIDGWLRIHDARTGAILWRFDTARTFPAVGGGVATGGAMGGGAAPIAYGGMLIAPSGYGFAGKMPGDALLVFTTK